MVTEAFFPPCERSEQAREHGLMRIGADTKQARGTVTNAGEKEEKVVQMSTLSQLLAAS